MNTDIKLFDTTALAGYLGVTEATLLYYRLRRKGPAYIKIGHLVRYHIDDVNAWLKTCASDKQSNDL